MIGSLILFLIFTLCSLIIICVASSAYSRISQSFDSTFNSSAAVRYLSNKIRSSDKCEIIENGSGIAVYSDGMVSVIYYNSEGIYEKSVSENSDNIFAEGGDKIFSVASMNISESKDGLYEIIVSSKGSFSTLCRN